MLGARRDTAASAASFADVFAAHHRRAVRLAWALTGDADAAEDAVAEVFAKVWVQWERGRVDDVGLYLRRAVVNQVRSRGRRRRLELREADRHHGDERGVVLVDELAAERDLVWQGLARLGARQRAAIVLRFYEDLSEAEIAAVLGISVGTVKSQVSRGLRRLRELMGTGGEV